MGIHIIADFLGVDPGKIARVEDLRAILDRVVSKSGLHAVSSVFHQFEPHGVSATYILSESHLSVHTWPEYGYVALDIFTCGSDECAFRAFDLLVEELKPKAIEKKMLRRDFYEKNRNTNTKQPPRVQ
ncbi:MAG: adenosylmethionine decarboxylase [Candidatus Bathyarchaeia archaeon]|nr:adenosylmethionine decarboxylase [Candidatus Bathyarchaeota archaeon]